jgi:hypothetical protein
MTLRRWQAPRRVAAQFIALHEPASRQVAAQIPKFSNFIGPLD